MSSHSSRSTFKSIWTATFRPFSSVTYWMPLIASFLHAETQSFFSASSAPLREPSYFRTRFPATRTPRHGPMQRQHHQELSFSQRDGAKAFGGSQGIEPSLTGTSLNFESVPIGTLYSYKDRPMRGTQP